MIRYGFLVEARPDGVYTLENLATRECVQIVDLSAVGVQIERWVHSLSAPADGEERTEAERP